MILLDVAVPFFLTSLLLALVPGPDNLFVLTQSALSGKKTGLVVVCGLCTGLIFHCCAVALGVAAIFQTSVVAFNLLKWVGAVYLVYLAYLSFRAPTANIEGGNELRLSSRKLYLRGIIMNITNPKVSIFFLAFLPQFVDPMGSAVSLQILQLGLLFMIATILVFGAVAILAGALGGWLNRSKNAQGLLNKMAGTVFLSLAIKLAFVKQ